MKVIWLIARSEAWHVCVTRRGGGLRAPAALPRGAIGYLGNIFNPSFGLAVRIAELRRTAPDNAPNAGTLVAAELPIVVIEIALAALCSFTLVAPLGVPWWAPLGALALGFAIVAAMSRLAQKKRKGFWNGLAVLRGLRHRNTIIALTIFAVSAQVFRNCRLNGVGDVSVFDSWAADRAGRARPAADGSRAEDHGDDPDPRYNASHHRAASDAHRDGAAGRLSSPRGSWDRLRTRAADRAGAGSLGDAREGGSRPGAESIARRTESESVPRSGANGGRCWASRGALRPLSCSNR